MTQRLLLTETIYSRMKNKRGNIPQWLEYLLPDQAAPGSNPCVPKKNSRNELLMLLMSNNGKWLENVDQTHLELASGKLVLQLLCSVWHHQTY